MLVKFEDRSAVTNHIDLSKYSDNTDYSIKPIIKSHKSNTITTVSFATDEKLSNSPVTTASTTNRPIKIEQFSSPQGLTKSMERPKSAKHNIERFKKSFYINYKRNLNMRNQNKTNTSYVDSENMFDGQNNENLMLDKDHELNNIDQMRNRKEQRMMASKSAFAGSMAHLRPKSARHNLEKYRQDVQQEIESLKKKHRHDIDEPVVNDSIMHGNEVTENFEHKLKNIENIDSIEKDGVDENIDSLDGLLIRETEDNSSSDEVDSQGSMNEIIPHLPPYAHSNTNSTTYVKNSQTNKSRSLTQQKQVTTNHKQKLLNRRGAVGDQQNGTSVSEARPLSNQTHASISTTTNTNPKEQNYTTSRSTLVSYSSTTPNTTNNSNAILVAKKTSQIQNEQEVTAANVIYHDYDEGGKIHLTSNTDNVPFTTNSSSPSSTSSQQLSSTNLAGTKEDCLHLNNTRDEEILILDNRSKDPINNLNDLVTQKLLNEWYRNDEEVELTVEKMNDYDQNHQVNNYIDYESIKHINIPPSKSQKSHPKAQQQQQSINNNNTQTNQNNKNINQSQKIILLNTTGRISRFSDFSSTSTQKNSVNNVHYQNHHHDHINLANTNALNASNLTKHQNYLAREKSSSSMDPWSRRNPTLVAQNVLMKHRTELEQLHNNRHNNVSRQSNNTASMMSSTNKYLLPDTKYYKKSNNY